MINNMQTYKTLIRPVLYTKYNHAYFHNKWKDIYYILKGIIENLWSSMWKRCKIYYNM